MGYCQLNLLHKREKSTGEAFLSTASPLLKVQNPSIIEETWMRETNVLYEGAEP